MHAFVILYAYDENVTVYSYMYLNIVSVCMCVGNIVTKYVNILVDHSVRF